MILEQELILNRIQDPAELSEQAQMAVEQHPQLSATLAETRILCEAGAVAAAPPERQALLNRVYMKTESSQEKHMTLINRLFSVKPLIARLALGLVVVLGLIALSVMLPRVVLTLGGMKVQPGPQAAFAATEGFLLLFDFGDASPEAMQPLVEQLTEAVRACTKAHNIPEEQAKREFNVGVTAEHKKIVMGHGSAAGGANDAPTEKQTQRFLVVVNLPDAKLLEELKVELAKIPGLPEPQVKDATWFSQEGLPIPGDDGIRLALNMGAGEHAFTFPKSSTPAEMEAAINEWLAAMHPDKQFKVGVVKEQEGDKTRIEVRIEGNSEQHSAAKLESKLDVATSGDEISLTLNFGDKAHTFSFAKNASEQQIAEVINAWLLENMPEHKVKVSVTKTDVDGKTQLEVKIEKVEVVDEKT